MIEPRSTDRERAAHEEMARTSVPRGLGRALLLLFLATIVLDSAALLARRPGLLRDFALARPEVWRGAWSLGPLEVNRRLRRQLEILEDLLERESVLAAWLREPSQMALLSVGIGNATVDVGTDGWLQLHDDVAFATGTGFLDHARMAARRLTLTPEGQPFEPDPRPALLRFGRDLAARGIALVLLPVPSKVQVAPETLVRLRPLPAGRIANPSFDSFVRELEQAGIRVFNALPVLRDERKRSGAIPFLKTDSHWNPAGMQAVARALAAELEREVDLGPRPEMTGLVETRRVSGTGNLLLQLRLGQRHGPESFEGVDVVVARGPDGRVWRPDPGAAVLVLGDSFTNVFSTHHHGFGVGAGFAEHLGLALGRPVDRIAIDGGAMTTRQAIAREIASGYDRLRGKRVVVLEIASRILATDDWPVVPLPSPTATPLAANDAPLHIEATIAAMAALPDPARAPYPDALVAVRLTGVRATSGQAPAELIAYLPAFIDRQPALASLLVPGATLRLRLVPWTVAESSHGSTMRIELLEDDALALPAYWGEPW